MTSGERRKAFWGAAAVIAVIALAVAAVNALTVIADRPEFAPWEPWSWELTSMAAILALIWIPWLAIRRAMPGETPWRRLIVIHALAAVVFSALHVAGFVAMREAVYALRGWDYVFGPVAERFPYELRKDALTYLAFAATFWAALRLTTWNTPPPPSAAVFDIRDGARIIRATPAEIIAVTAAGNYAEFILNDGRRPLMRTTLARLEEELRPLGLIRTHRSWLVNPAHLTGLAPDGSGDWTVELGEIRAPVSRRYPQALERLRG